MQAIEHTLEVPASLHRYRAVVGSGLLEEAGRQLGRSGLGGRVLVIADETAWTLHGARLLRGLGPRADERDVLLLPCGESAKSLPRLAEVYDWLLERGVERGDCLLAFGGGVTGDLAGFAAATVLRGVPLVQVPTTLLAQVDSSIGGKTGINHPRGKNLIGAFHQPSLVLADVEALRTLPRRQVAAGWAEVVKMAVTLDAELFSRLEADPASLLDLAPEVTIYAVARSIELKGGVVTADEREGGLRMVLNYGHTIGHAIEAATNFEGLLHGEAVAIGMVGVGLMAERLGLLPADQRARQDRLLAALGLPARFQALTPEQLWPALLHDKKARAGQLTWVLCNGIGSFIVRRDVPRDLVEDVLRFVTRKAPSTPAGT